MKMRKQYTACVLAIMLLLSYQTSFAQEYHKVAGFISSSPVIGIDNMSDGRIVLACENGDVFVAKDNNNNEFEKWCSLGQKIKGVAVQAIDDSLVIEQIVLAAENGKVFFLTGREQKSEREFTGIVPNDVHYVPDNNNPKGSVYLVGNNSKILVSKDGCNTFTEQFTPYKFDDFNSVFFKDASRGWIVGSTGIIYNTFNGGTNWNYVEGDHSNPNYYGVAFLSYLKGYVVGSGGFIGYTSNEGNTWTKQNSTIADNLNDIAFAGGDSDAVRLPIAVGDNGALISDSNLDGNWEKTSLGTTNNLYKVAIDKSGYVWIGGENGSVYTNKPPLTKPNAPTELTVTNITSYRVELGWKDNSGNESGFIIERKNGPNDPWLDSDTTAVNVVVHHDSGLTPNKEYHYRVSAYNSEGESSYSNEVNATTLNVVPSKPTNLTATPKSSSQIDLSWLDNSNNETGFKIERKTEQQEFSEIGGADSNATAYTDRNLDDGLNYIYRVASLNTIGKSPYSNESSATTQLSAPTNLTAKKSTTGAAQLDWKDNSKSENGFTIEKKSGTGNFSKLTDVATNSTSYIDSQVNVGQQLSFRVQAFNSIIISGFSNTADIVITSVNNGIEIPTEYSLKQNYPNPFNPETIISYELPEAGYVTLKVFDILGNEIVTLVNNYKSAGKHYTTLITTDSKFTSGCYIYKLTAGSFSSVRKMLLIK
ncbi:MAG: fibronectin type III domain-containing protein [Stygiobacter sp.]|nr:MAG: fibronectin type III domain-containing protein [Stygiobacter sp.]KAF0214279.1 MAG: fibronectin type III domain-containing [Ignavibacteria bacterium]